jgi:anti-sigma regulatory factor (Ser/Thr protein kinase)
MSIEDMFSIKDNFVYEKLKGKVNLRDTSLKKIIVPNDFSKKYLKLSPDKDRYKRELKNFIYILDEKFRKFGYKNNIITGIYETILNAHQHGNLCDSSKKILYADKIDNNKLEIIVADEGELLDENFLPFVLYLRENPKRFVNYYDFGKDNINKNPGVNYGTGTSFMHIYFDKVNYYVSEELGGLAVKLTKYNNF